jgi:hypothetical protein
MIGVLMYPFSVARTVLEGCADIAASAPEELTAQLGLIAGADGSPVVMIVPTWCGVRTEGESRLAPFLKLGTVLANTIDEMPYGISSTAFDPYLVTGQHEFMETCWLAAFDDDCIDAFMDVMANALPGCAIFTHEFRGAASRVAPEATAFGLRRDHVLVELLTTFGGRSVFDERRYQQWLQVSIHAFDAIALPGGYPNWAIRAVPRKALVATLSGLLKPSAPTIPRMFFARPFPFRSCAVSKSLGAHP